MKSDFLSKIGRVIGNALTTFAACWIAIIVYPLNAIAKLTGRNLEVKDLPLPDKPSPEDTVGFGIGILGYVLTLVLTPLLPFVGLWLMIGVVSSVVNKTIRRNKGEVYTETPAKVEDEIPQELREEIAERYKTDLVEVSEGADLEDTETKPTNKPSVSKVYPPESEGDALPA